ncbi:MAG: hypothetical protein H0W50_05745, partial [Parachlamydiaceae bacterium]|nr:hypothetical protein [Parachlamydiaceae bacterium]
RRNGAFSDEGLEEEPAQFIEEITKEESEPVVKKINPQTPSIAVTILETSLEDISSSVSIKKDLKETLSVSSPSVEKSESEAHPISDAAVEDVLKKEPAPSQSFTDKDVEAFVEEPLIINSPEPKPVAEQVLTEVMLEEVLEEVSPFDEAAIEVQHEEKPGYAEENLVEGLEELSPSDRKVLEEPFSLIVSESFEPLEDALLPQADVDPFQEVNLEEGGSELDAKVKELNDLNLALAECYEEIAKKGELLPKLRNAFPEKLSKMTADLNQLDPVLQDEINRGNVAFFNENPDKAKEAGGVLLQLQELNFILQESNAIPRDVDRLFSKGRQIRKQLDASWAYFSKHRKEIKDANPNFVFPHPPSQLAVKEPVFNIIPKDNSPSPLVGKRVAVVRTPPLKK